MLPTSGTGPGDDARAKLGALDTALDELSSWWRDPSRRLGEYVTAGQVSAVNAERQHDHTALGVELEALQAERGRLKSLIMDGHPAGPGEVAALAERVERLRREFAAQMG